MRGYTMKTPERLALARELREEGKMLREIGELLGVATQTVNAWLKDPDGHKLRARKDSYRGECIDCGKPTNGSSGPGKSPDRCVLCNGAHTRALSRRWILDSFREWHEMFGQQPAATDWEPAMHADGPARQRARERRDATGRPWPSPTVVINNFGSWNAGVAAAGFTPTPVGNYRDESKRRRGMTVERLARRERIAAMWLAGLSGPDIARRLDIATSYVYAEVDAMRDEGRALPLRGASTRVLRQAA